MNFVNSITLTGIVSEDPKYTTGQKSTFLNLKLYTESKAYKPEDAPARIEHYVKAYGQVADMNQYTKKGDIVCVSGMIKEDQYQDQASGQMRKYRFVQAFSMVSCEPPISKAPTRYAGDETGFSADDDIPF